MKSIGKISRFCDMKVIILNVAVELNLPQLIQIFDLSASLFYNLQQSSSFEGALFPYLW